MKYQIVLTQQAKEDYLFWKSSGNKAIQNKILSLLEDISQHPYTGIGKPEPLKYVLSGYWSRRINSEHRIVYRVLEDEIEVEVMAMRYHYK